MGEIHVTVKMVEERYRTFCQYAADPEYRRAVLGRSGFRFKGY